MVHSLVIVTHVDHVVINNIVHAYSPYVRELKALAKRYENIVIFCPQSIRSLSKISEKIDQDNVTIKPLWYYNSSNGSERSDILYNFVVRILRYFQFAALIFYFLLVLPKNADLLIDQNSRRTQKIIGSCLEKDLK